jgi:hypothetical protein
MYAVTKQKLEDNTIYIQETSKVDFYIVFYIILSAMPKSKKGGGNSRGDKQLSARTKKQIDSLPEHAQHIYKKAHSNALEQYQNP